MRNANLRSEKAKNEGREGKIKNMVFKNVVLYSRLVSNCPHGSVFLRRSGGLFWGQLETSKKKLQ